MNRRHAEQRLLQGIKNELLAPKSIRAIAKLVNARLREADRPGRKNLQAELTRIDRELGNVVDSLAKLGGSAALLARVRALESEKATVVAQLKASDKPPRIGPNVEKAVRAKLAVLEDIPRDALTDETLTERARATVRDYIGEAKVIEVGEHVVANVDLGHWYISHGAEERT